MLVYLLIAVLIFGFGMNEVRFFLFGDTTTATVVGVSREFVGFANDDVSGTTPSYQYQIAYWYAADGKKRFGEINSHDDFAAEGRTVTVQFIRTASQQHRILTPSLQLFRLCYLGMILALGVWLAHRLLGSLLSRTTSGLFEKEPLST